MKRIIEAILQKFGNCDINIKENDSEVTITVKKLDKEKIDKVVKDFNNFVSNIDDDYFNEICDVFSKLSDNKLNYLALLMKSQDNLPELIKYTDLFKSATKQFITEHISKLQNKYLK